MSRDTIVVYVTDNGWIQDSERPRYAEKSKQSPYDGGLRTPIMVRWPARVSPEKSTHLASSLDIAPTLLAAVGLKPTADMPGLNLFDGAAVAARKSVFGECFTHNAVDIERPATSLRWRWVVSGDWKLIVPTPWNEPKAVVELYNLKDDPHETHNRAADHADRVRALREQLDQWWNPGE